MPFTVLFNDDTAPGDGAPIAFAVPFSSTLRNVNFQVDPGSRTAYSITVEGRVSADDAWQALVTKTQAASPLFEVPAYPLMQVKVTSFSGGSGDLKVAYHRSPPPAGYVLHESTNPELSYLLPPPTELFSTDAEGNGEPVDVPFSEQLQHVTWQLSVADTGLSSAWDVKIQARIDDTMPWADVAQTDSADTDGPESGPIMTGTLAAYPQYRGVVTDNTTAEEGTDVLTMKLFWDPVAPAGVMVHSEPSSEYDALT